MKWADVYLQYGPGFKLTPIRAIIEDLLRGGSILVSLPPLRNHGSSYAGRQQAVDPECQHVARAGLLSPQPGVI